MNIAQALLALFIRIWGRLWVIWLRLSNDKNSAMSRLAKLRTTAQADAEAQLAALPKPSGPGARVLLLIPFRDRSELTARCVDSICRQEKSDQEWQVVLIDNGSTEPATADWLQSAQRQLAEADIQVEVLREDQPFNFSRLNNVAVRELAHWKPDALIFINNDIELRGPSDLARLADFCRGHRDVGAVGGTLLYPDNRIQHLFLAPGIKIVAGHPLKGEQLQLDDPWFDAPRAVPAVTGALLCVDAQAFQEIGGFDERLPTIGQDVDLCLKLQAGNKINWVLPRVMATHLETATRRDKFDYKQVARLYERWGKTLTRNPFFHPRLSRWTEAPLTASYEPPYPWWLVIPRR